jgi:hypothetical protein
LTQLFMPRWLRLALGGLALLALLMATAAPIVASLGHVEAVGLYMALEPVCHQLRERSWVFGDLSAGLCIRCYGVYSGIAAAALMGWPFSRRMAAGGALALGAVWAAEHLVGAPVPEMARFASGGAFGAALASVTAGAGMPGSRNDATQRRVE